MYNIADIFNVLTVVFCAGINVGAAAAMSSLLNEFIHVYFPVS